MRIPRLGTISLLTLALSTIAGGWLGERVLAGGGRLGEHLRVYTAIISTIEEQYVEDVETRLDVAQECRDSIRGGQIDLEGAYVGQCLAEPGKPLWVAATCQHGVAPSRQLPHEAKADPARAPRHDHVAARQLHPSLS